MSAFSLPQRHSRLHSFLTAPVDAAGLAAFRIAFGLLMAWESVRYLERGWVERHILAANFHFTYWPFDFVAPLPGPGMYVVLVLMGLLGICVAAGLCYRMSSLGLFLMLCYVFLVEQALYLNHFYLICLLAGILACLPAARVLSFDNLLSPQDPPKSTVPRWAWWLVLFQLAVPMTFGGLAKLNADWLTRGEPLAMWLARRSDYPLIGPFVAENWFVWGMVYGAIAIDLFFIAYILNFRTRIFGYILLLGFHLLNALMFSIGIFPWMMMLATLCFFGPSWPRYFIKKVRQPRSWAFARVALGGLVGLGIGACWPTDGQWGGWSVPIMVAAGVSFAGAGLYLTEPFQQRTDQEADFEERPAEPMPQGHRLGVVPLFAFFLVPYLVFQVLMPLRHYAIPNNVHWTEAGHNFSWHMKLRSKASLAEFQMETHDGSRYTVDPTEHLTGEQLSKMSDRPALIWQYAKFLEREAEQQGLGDVAIHGNVLVSLNGRDFRPLLDPDARINDAPRPNPLWGHRGGWVTDF